MQGTKIKNMHKTIKYCIVYFIVLILGFSQWLQAQTNHLSGKVLSEKERLPVDNALITASKNRKTVVTNSEGEFSIRLTIFPDTLTISYIGHPPVKRLVNKKDLVIQILLPGAEDQVLNEVQVSTGYQRIPKERATGSFSVISNKVFNQQVSTDILSRLEAVANGLKVDRLSSVGSSKLSIRGLSSINGPKDPLIILDNFPYEGDITGINPNDVQDITLLKDAAAASIWGAKAGNGVIVITTKKGSYNQPISVEVAANMTIGEKPNLFYNKQISSGDFIDAETFLFNNKYRFSDTSASSRPVFSPVYEILFKQMKGQLSATDASAQINSLRNLDVRNDFNRYLYQQSVSRQIALTVRGGSAKNNWLLSTGADKNSSNLAAGYQRINLQLQNQLRLAKNLELTSSVYYTQSENSTGKPGYKEVSSYNNGIAPYTSFADNAGNPIAIPYNYRTTYIDTAGQGKLLDWHYYPLTDWQNSQTTVTLRDVLVNTGLKYKILDGLTIDLKYQYENQWSSSFKDNTMQSFFTRNLINKFSQVNFATGVVTYKVPKGDIVDVQNTSMVSNSFRSQLGYNKNMGHSSLSVILGQELRESVSNGNGFWTYGYNSSNLTIGNVDYTNSYPNYITKSNEFTPSNNYFSGGVNRFVSFYGNMAYSCKGKYTLSFSGRKDASNLYGVDANNKWNLLWSTGLAWDISKESFFRVKALDYLKARITYGTSGNTDPARSAVTTILYLTNSPYSLQPMATYDQFANPELKWETIGMLNMGLDFRTKNNRVSGSIEYYEKNGKNLYGPALLDYTGGARFSITKNVASMKTRGWDLELNTLNTKGAFEWTTNLNLSINKDQVSQYYLASLQGSKFVAANPTVSGVVGSPVYSVFGYQWAGLDPATGDPQGYINNQVSKDYSKLTGASTQLKDLVYSGSALPTVFGSMGNTFSWKSVSFTFRILYKLGYYFHRESINYYNLAYNWQGHSDYALRWQNPGDELKTNVPSMAYPLATNRENFYNSSAILVDRGDYIRLQYISLGYSFNGKALKALNMKRLQAFANLNNIGLIWKANTHGIDPEYKGSFNGVMPPPLSISFGINASF